MAIIALQKWNIGIQMAVVVSDYEKTYQLKDNAHNSLIINALESKIKYQFFGKIWRANPVNGWYFITVPHHFSKEIREKLQWQEEGWGRMKVAAQIRAIKWDTSIWYDTKVSSYILPLKSEIRQKLSLKENDRIDISLFV